MILTYQYRIKDSTSRKKLTQLASSVNFVWNYINNLSFQNIKKYSRFLSEYDINKYLAGCASELNLHSTTPQEISKHYVSNRKTAKKRKLAWRSAKRSLGWIPFKASAIKLIADDEVKYKDVNIRFYRSRPLPIGAVIKTGSFNQDSRGRWYLNLKVDVELVRHQHPEKEIGIDLGIKNNISLSNGQTFERDNVSKLYEKRLAVAQRANKKKQVKNISAKIKNIRKDWAHKVTAQIAKQFESIYVGNVSPQDILGDKTKVNRSIYDAAIYQIKSFLQYKAVKLGGKCYLVEEQYTTQTCNVCGEKTGPKGKEGLSIREWNCPCGASHDRDINSAINILRMGHHTLKKIAAQQQSSFKGIRLL